MPQFDTQFLSPLLFWSIVSFGVLLFFLYKYGLPTIIEALDARERTIRDNLAEAERLRKEAQEKLEQYQLQIRETRSEAEGIIEEAKRENQRLLEENERRLRQESENMISQARHEISREKQEASQEIRRETAQLVLLATERVLQRSLTDADHQRLIEQALEEFSERFQGGKK